MYYRGIQNAVIQLARIALFAKIVNAFLRFVFMDGNLSLRFEWSLDTSLLTLINGWAGE